MFTSSFKITRVYQTQLTCALTGTQLRVPSHIPTTLLRGKEGPTHQLQKPASSFQFSSLNGTRHLGHKRKGERQ